MTIVSVADLPTHQRASALMGAERVFWATASRTEFETSCERAAYRDRWFARYVDADPGACFVACLTSAPSQAEDITCVGYCFGALGLAVPHSQLPVGPKESRVIRRIDPDEPEPFHAVTQIYPSHLHINLATEVRGCGIGQRLIAAFCAYAADAGSPGVRVVTRADADNVGFYNAMQFQSVAAVQVTLGSGEAHLVLLARALS